MGQTGALAGLCWQARKADQLASSPASAGLFFEGSRINANALKNVTGWGQINHWRKPVAHGALASLEIPTASAVGASPQQQGAEPPTAHAVGIAAITFVNHWLTPVVGLGKLM